jgi:DNA-binding transcriptional MerR regulator
MTVVEIEASLGIKRKVVHRWVARGLLSAPTPRGPRTTYDEAQLLRLRVIQVLRRRQMGLEAIKKWLLSATRDQLDALLPPAAPAAGASPAAAVSDPAAARSEKWERAVLVPGLELHMRLDASPLARRLAHEIFERYSVLARDSDVATGAKP